MNEFTISFVLVAGKTYTSKCHNCVFYNPIPDGHSYESNCLVSDLNRGYDCFDGDFNPGLHGVFKLTHKLTDKIIPPVMVVSWYTGGISNEPIK